MKNPHDRNDRWYIDGMLAEAGLPDPEPGDEVVFEMPPFCSGDYSAPIHFDEHGVPYILRKESYLPGCRDWSIRRNRLNRQARHIHEQMDRAATFASGRPEAWSQLYAAAIHEYGLILTQVQPTDEPFIQASFPPSEDKNPYRMPAWVAPHPVRYAELTEPEENRL